MTKPATQPPHPITAILILTLAAGLIMMLILGDGPGHTVGIGMVIVGVIGLIWRRFTAAAQNKPHTTIHTSGADRGRAKKH